MHDLINLCVLEIGWEVEHVNAYLMLDECIFSERIVQPSAERRDRETH